MRSWLARLLLFVVSALLLTQLAYSQATTTTTQTTTQKTTNAKPRARRAQTAKAPTAKAPAARPTTTSEMKTLRDAVSAQQQQIQMLRDELQRRDAAVQQLQTQVNQLQSTAQQAQSTAQAAESTSKQNEDALNALKTNVGQVSTSATATATSLQGTEKRISALEAPTALRYKGITITPGGFLSANVNWRQHNQNGDNFASFTGIPFPSQAGSAYYLPEFRETARYSRISLLAQGKAKNFNVQAYYEMDFEGAAATGNENQTNSFQPRIREAWVNVDGPKGVSFAGGQTWSLLTSNRTGVGVRGLGLPAHIDASIVLGYHYARQNTFRVYKKWEMANKKALYLAFSVENPETTNTGTAPTGVTILGLQGSPGQPTAAAPASAFAAPISVDAAPDVVGKVAIEPGWGHFELAGIGRFFRDRVLPGGVTGAANLGSNHTTPGGGVSFNAILPVVPKKVDIMINSLAGRGVGRYLGVSDVTFRPDGRLEPVRNLGGMLGIETHPTAKLDFLVYAGDVYSPRDFYTAASGAFLTGYGSPTADLRGCMQEIPATGLACSPLNKNNYEITPGFWYRFYRGPMGTLQFGTFYEYLYRSTWAGRTSSTVGAAPGPIHVSQSVILSAFRWYFP